MSTPKLTEAEIHELCLIQAGNEIVLRRDVIRSYVKDGLVAYRLDCGYVLTDTGRAALKEGGK